MCSAARFSTSPFGMPSGKPRLRMCGALTAASGKAPRLPRRPCKPRRQHGETLADGATAPCCDLLYAERRHFQRDKMIALAHIEAPRAVGIIDVAEIDILL